ncbi:helicase [Methylorubrum aminovorans]
MSTRLKPFQAATVDAACATLQHASGPRRFLVADEVGLGKTVVAREIVRRLAEGKRRRPLTVFYVTNGQRVGTQNRGRLIDFLPESERMQAISRADRIGLIPMTDRPAASVALYALTPTTSFPGNAARLSEGRKEERAFVQALLRRTYPRLIRRLPRDFMRARAKRDWAWLIAQQQRRVAEVPKALIKAFREALRQEFGGDPRSKLPQAAAADSRRKTLSRLRRALAHAALLSSPPDLVIFDEFQRYRDLLSERGREDRLMATLLGRPTRGTPPAILLLSATPYRAFASRWEESRGVEAHAELFALIEFLAGDTEGAALRERVEKTFGAFGDRLRTIASTPANADVSVAVAQARAYRTELQESLAPLLSRTEREIGVSDDEGHTVPLKADLVPSDIHAFRHLVTGFQKRHRGDALAYWLSVPLPAQALGNGYQAWRQAEWRRDRQLVRFTAQNRDRFKLPTVWPHPKLRALVKTAPPQALALPWARPSLEWWPLDGSWADASGETKLLLFSRFKATPQSIAAALSFGVEAAFRGSDKARYARIWRRRKLQPGAGRMPVLGLFNPSPFLINAFDPLSARGSSLSDVRKLTQRRLKEALSGQGIEVRKRTAKEKKQHRPAWALIAALDARVMPAKRIEAAWKPLVDRDQGLADMRDAWQAAEPVTWIGPRELKDLVEAAIAYPGVVTGRALLRHFGAALEQRHYADLVALCWSGLRPYLDKPVFWAALKGGTPAESLPRAVLDGGFESLLDEHFWILKGASTRGGADIAGAMHEALSVVTGSFGFHAENPRDDRIRVRCHAAVAFGGSDAELESLDDATGQRQARSEELRKAFNAPFWPHVLATTSAGQEGLDFHTWCARVAHWDLCASPLDLEQREGRIQRFGGLLVRRRLAKSLGEELLKQPRGERRSVWDDIAALAEQRHGDPTGLSPWWLLPDAKVTRYVFELPHGRDVARMARLREQRFIYRLALGQPNQEDMVDVLANTDAARRAILRPLALDLSAFGRSMHALANNPAALVAE